jgi:VWFA-related protein
MMSSWPRRPAAAFAMVAGLVAALPAGPGRPAVQSPKFPTFFAGVGVVSVDVHVLDSSGRPVDGLTMKDFEVWFDGRKRKVVSATLLRHADETMASSPARRAPVMTPGRMPYGTRLYVIAVDEGSFPMASVRPAMQAVARFVTRLAADDMVGLYVFPIQPRQINLTHDHAAVARALETVTGLREWPIGEFELTVSEIIDITAGDALSFDRIRTRECTDPADASCPDRLRSEAHVKAAYFEAQAAQSVSAFGMLLASLNALPGRKTVLLLSGGLLASDRTGGRPDVMGMLRGAADQAEASNTHLFVVHVDNSLFDSLASGVRSRSQSDRFESMFRDRDATARGLDFIAGYAGGALLRIEAGTGDHVFDRVLRETSAHYLIGVESAQNDRDGRTHAIRVRVNAKGATVRHRKQVQIHKTR